MEPREPEGEGRRERTWTLTELLLTAGRFAGHCVHLPFHPITCALLVLLRDAEALIYVHTSTELVKQGKADFQVDIPSSVPNVFGYVLDISKKGIQK